MTVSGGEVDFKYDHSVYWPALEKLSTERRQQRKERWEKGGKLIGESEIYLWGGDEGSISGDAATHEDVANGKAKVPENNGNEATVVDEANGTANKDDVALANGVTKLDVNGSEEPKKPQEQAVPTVA